MCSSDLMAVFMLDDEGGKVKVVVFPEAYSRYGGLIADDALLLVRGKYERDDDSGSLKANELVPLDVVREKAIREVLVTVPASQGSKEFANTLRSVFERYPGDRRVSIVINAGPTSDAPDGLRIKTLIQRRVKPTDQFVRDVEALCGAGSVELV